MLAEIKHPRQIEGEPERRWFTDDYFDLVVWESPEKQIVAFQLCYNKGPDEKALTWRKDQGFTHKGVDDGEGRDGQYKMTPILVPDGTFERDSIIDRFQAESVKIADDVRAFIIERLSEYNQS